MTSNLKTLLFAAAVSGLFAGTSAANASVLAPSGASSVINAGTMSYSGMNAKGAKHSCKGQNNCKGQGGCKSSDNGCKGKNSCKGQGGCATNGHPEPNNCSAKSKMM